MTSEDGREFGDRIGQLGRNSDERLAQIVGIVALLSQLPGVAEVDEERAGAVVTSILQRLHLSASGIREPAVGLVRDVISMARQARSDTDAG